MKTRSLVSLLLVIAMTLTLAFSFAGCSDGVDGADGITPRLRINSETNYWEVSYDNGETWISMEVNATGADGKDGTDGITPKLRINAETNYWEVSYDNEATWTSLGIKATGEDGKDGKDGKDGADGKDGTDGKDGVDGQNGADGKDGADGQDGTDGKDGANGANGTDGNTPYIGDDGYWYIGDECTYIYAGTPEVVTVTFVEIGGNNDVKVSVGSKVESYEPACSIATFLGWYADEACTEVFDFDTVITENTTVYSKWEFEETFQTVGTLMESVSFGKASCFGTSACFGSVYYRVLVDAHDYYDGAAGIANYLKGVFVEDENGVVSVNTSSSLRRISYTDALTVINFSSAFSSYNEYIIRNGLEMPEDIAAQKELAIKYFNTVDYTVDGYNTHTGSGMTFPSMAVAVVAMGDLMEQTETERYDTLIKAAYENIDASFYNSGMYLQPFYQLCAKYDWYDMTSIEAEVAALTSLTDANVLKYYGYGIDLANDYADLWDAWEQNALSDNALTAAEAKAFAYHYAYQLTDGEAHLGVYGNSRAIVDFSVVAD